MDKYQKIAEQKFEDGLFCAESVLATVAERFDINSPLIPKIATGFCSGVARIGGMCGAITGGILGLNIFLGRDCKDGKVDTNYDAVQSLLKQFQQKYGTINCTELLGCNLGTKEGQDQFKEENLRCRCKEFTGFSARLAITLIEEKSH